MANLTGSERADYVQEMFARIAHRYDLMNRVMTLGQDSNWRREVIQRAALPTQGRLLDLGAGTGDLAREARRQYPSCHSLAADFTLEMMLIGRESHENERDTTKCLEWTAADAHVLPFSDAVFDAVVSGFLLRNVTDVTQSLSEQYRVLKPGGKIVTLDTTPPPRTPLAPVLRLHMHTIIPLLGNILTGQKDAYHYLPDTTESFLEPEQLASRLMGVGFQEVGFQRLMFGTIAIHWGCKSDEPIRRSN